ncbi:MAG: porin [Ketobacter sp.]|nr:porin [Ketobacter sp.]
MKVKLLPLAIGAAIAMPGVALADGPTVYGKVNVSYEMVGWNVEIPSEDLDLDSDNWQVISNASRVGVKGSENITDDLKAIYQIEWGVNIDSGTDMSQRDRFVGLSGGFGTVKVGKFDSPLKKAQGKVDLFNDLSGDIRYVIVGENRLSNVIQYSTAGMGGVQFNIALQPGEEYDLDLPDQDAKDGPADAFSTSVTFEQDGLYGAIAYDSEVGSSIKNPALDELLSLLDSDDADDLEDGFGGLSTRFDTLRLVGQYKMDAFQFGLIYQMAENSDEDVDGVSLEQDGYVLSAGFTAGSNLFKVQYSASTTELEGVEQDIDVEALSLGVDHKLSKQTTAYAYYNTYSFEFSEFDSGKDNLGVGIVHKF